MASGSTIAAAELTEPRWLLLLLLSLPPLHFPSSSTRGLLPLCSTCLPSLLIDCHCVWWFEWCDLRECGGKLANRKAKGRVIEGRAEGAASEPRAASDARTEGRKETRGTERDRLDDDEMSST